MLIRMMRVNADTGVNIRRLLRRAHDLRPFGLFRRNIEKGLNPYTARTIEHGFLFVDQPLIFQVTMAIDQHHAASSVGSSRRGKTGVGLSIACSAVTNSPNQLWSERSAYLRRSVEMPS